MNIRILNCNHSKFLLLLSELSFHFDIIVLTEIGKWNTDFFHNIMTGYKLFVDLPIHGNFGGVGIFVKSVLACTVLPDLKLMKPAECKTDKNIIEDVWLEITNNHETFLIRGNLQTSKF